MRKDLKIGMAIGAVLLVVLIVYLAVPDNSKEVAQDTSGAQVTEPTETTTKEPPAVTEESTAPEASIEVKPPAAPVEKGEVATKEKEKEDPFASQGSMWANILKTGEMTPLRATTPGVETATPVGDPAPVAPKVEEPVAEPATPTTPDNTVAVDPNAKTDAKATESEKTTEAVADSKTGARTHTVKAGEDFSKIAREAYGDGRLYLAIVKANPTIEPTRLKPGTVITLPDIASTGSEPAAKAAAGSVTVKREKEIDPEREYRIQSGDSLYKISMKQYGTSNMVEALYDANKATIGNDSSRLKLGMVIKLPSAPTASR